MHFDPSAMTPEGQHETSAIQQLLTNISAAAGTDEVLSFGVGTSGTQRTRGKYIRSSVFYGIVLKWRLGEDCYSDCTGGLPSLKH